MHGVFLKGTQAVPPHHRDYNDEKDYSAVDFGSKIGRSLRQRERRAMFLIKGFELAVSSSLQRASTQPYVSEVDLLFK